MKELEKLIADNEWRDIKEAPHSVEHHICEECLVGLVKQYNKLPDFAKDK